MIDPPFRRHPAHLVPPPYACKHHDFTNTPSEYYEYHTWMKNRILDGEEQKCCPRCKCWLFPEEMNEHKDSPQRFAIDMLKLIEDILRDELIQYPGSLKDRIYKDRLKKLRKRVRVLQWR